MEKLISKTYKDALLATAIEKKMMDTLYEEAGEVLGILLENKEFLKFLRAPDIEREEKLSVLEAVFGGKISPELLGLMRITVEKKREGLLTEILHDFIAGVKAYKKIGSAFVSSAVKLTEAQKQRITETLLRTTDYVEIELHDVVDPSLIGGAVIRIGDRVADGSVKNKLYQLKRELSKIRFVC